MPAAQCAPATDGRDYEDSKAAGPVAEDGATKGVHDGYCPENNDRAFG